MYSLWKLSFYLAVLKYVFLHASAHLENDSLIGYA